MHPLSSIMSTNIVLHFHDIPSADWFRNTLKTINRVYKFVSIEKIVSYYYNNEKFNNRCHITFDDGDRASYENAFPVLKEMNISATLFVSPKIISNGYNYWFQDLSHITNRVGDVSLKETISDVLSCDHAQIERYMVSSLFKSMKIRDILQVIGAVKKKHAVTINNPRNITLRELHELSNSNIITIGAHTMNHPVLSNETDADAEKEIIGSIESLAQILGQDVRYFAYPNGISGLDYGVREQSILQKNKIKLSFTTDNGFFSKDTKPLSCPRHGLGGLEKENNTRILGRFFFLPVWDVMRNVLKPKSNELKEIKERKEIKKLDIFTRSKESIC